MGTTEGLYRTKTYWNLRAEGYSKNVNAELDGDVGKDWASFLTELAPLDTHRRVLDIGCGPGFFSILLSLRGYEVTAVDYTENMLMQARENAEKRNARVKFMQMDAQELSFGNDSFDLIVTRNVTWNLEDPLKAYSEWFRVLRKGGKLVNADGNHFYYVADPDYRLFYEKSERDHKYMDGIDTGIINALAEKNPLARELRPAWDIRTAFDLGAQYASARITDEYIMPDSGKRLIENFIMTAEK